MTGKISEDPDKVLDGTEKFAASHGGGSYGPSAASIAAYVAALELELTNKAINAALNTVSNLALSMFAAGVIDTDSTFAGDSDDKLPTQKAVKAAVRDRLTVARAYYVRTDGSDSNNGLANTAGGAFLTLQKAIDVAAALDTSIYDVTINVAAGTFTDANTLKKTIGAGAIKIVGAGNTTIISVTGNHCFFGSECGVYEINSLKVQTTTSGYGIFLSGATKVTSTSIEFGGCATGHMRVTEQARYRLFAYTISGNAPIHYAIDNGGRVTCVSVTVVLSGTPAFSTAFASLGMQASLWVEGVTWSGSATGPRYTVIENSVLKTGTGVTTTLPGNSAHATPTASGGQYL